MFERNIIRKIYGPVMENNIWRIRHDEEINTLLKGEDIVRFIKSQNKMVWGMSKEWKIKQCQRVLKGRLYSKRRKGTPRMRWIDDVESDLKKMKVKAWKEKLRNRKQ
jgi:hypothetical protein